MTTAAAITEIIQDHLDVEDDDSLPTAQNAPLRRQCLRKLQDGVNWLYTSYNWSWRVAPEPITVLADGYYVPLPLSPVNYECPGEFMTMFVGTTELYRKSVQSVSRLINTTPQIGTPLCWAPITIFDNAVGVTSDMAIIYPGVATNTPIIVDKFMQSPPTLVDGETALFDGSDPEGSTLNNIPPTLQRSILIPYAVRQLMRMQGDARGSEVQGDYIDALARAWREDVVQSTSRRSTRYGRRGRLR